MHFGQQNHETFLEMPPNSSHMPPSYFARKQGHPLLDIDLNVAGEGVLEDMASESTSQTTVSISGSVSTHHAPSRIAGGVDLDLNRVDDGLGLWKMDSS